MRNQFSFLNWISEQLRCWSRLWWIMRATLSKPGNVFSPERLNPSRIYLNHLPFIVRSRTQSLIGLNADWQNELIWQLICPKRQEEPGCLIIDTRKLSVKTVRPGKWTAVCVAVPLWHQMGGERQELSCHTVCQYVSTSSHLSRNHFKIYWTACRKEKDFRDSL